MWQGCWCVEMREIVLLLYANLCCVCVVEEDRIGVGVRERVVSSNVWLTHGLLVGIGELERVRLKVDLSSTVRAALLFRLLGTETLALGDNHVQVGLVTISGL